MERPTQSELLDFLAPISAMWREIGRALNLTHNFLDGLDPHTSTVVKLDKVIYQWLINGDQDRITWGKVIAILEGNTAPNKEIAKKIQKYLAER